MTSPANTSRPSSVSSGGLRDSISSLSLCIGLFGAPIAWIVQFFVVEPLASQACYPHQAPLSAPLLPGLSLLLAAVSIVLLMIAIVCGFVAWRSWQRATSQDQLKSFSPDNFGSGRTRFLLKLSMMSSLMFITAISFNVLALALVSPCSSWF
jgi:hypothetical protein